MSTLCKSRKHSWSDPQSALFCCNGYHRELRGIGDMRGAELAGVVRVEGMSLVNVWVKNAPDYREFP